jgi:hypothetical protein
MRSSGYYVAAAKYAYSASGNPPDQPEFVEMLDHFPGELVFFEP